MVQLSVPSPLAKSELAYEDSLKETEEAPAETNLLQLPVPSLNLKQLRPVVASLSSRQKSLQQKELEAAYAAEQSFQLTTAQLCRQESADKSFQLTTAQLCRQESAEKSLRQKELEAAYSAEKSFQLTEQSFQLPIAQLCFKAQSQEGQTKARELALSLAQRECSTKASRTTAAATAFQDPGTATATAFQHPGTAAATAAGKLQVAGDLRSTAAATAAGKLQVAGDLRNTAAATAAGKLQVAGDLRSPESIHYEPLPQTMQSYLALDVHDMYMDLRNVAQNNLAEKGPDPAGAEELRYENVFPNLTTGSVDLVVQAETSSHPERPAINGVKGEVGSIDSRGGRSTTFLFKFFTTFIMAVWANLPFSLWPGMGMSASFAYTIVGFKGQSNPVKKVMFADAIEGVIFIVMSSLDIRRMIFRSFRHG